MKKSLLLLLFITVISALNAQEPGKTYAISQDTKSVFINNADLSSGKQLVMWSDTKVPAQRWMLEQLEDGTYAFRNLYTNLYLGVNGTMNGASADHRTFSTYLSRWNLEPSGDGYMFVPVKNEALCLTALSTDEGASLKLLDKATADPVRSVFTLTPDTEEIPTSYNAAVRDAIMDGFLGQYYHKAGTGHVLGGGGWWGDAEMFETILDAFITTGDLRYKEIFHELYVNFCQRNGTDWSGNEYNDDITWMVLACVRAYKYFGDTDYLNKARDNYDRMYKRGKQIFGTLIWKQSQSNKLATNSCINCPATIAACYLAQMTGDKAYYDKALSIYAGQRKLLFNASNGEVWDSRAWNSDGTGASDWNHWVSTYNQGTMLGAAVALYEYTKQPMYLEDAQKIYAKSVSALTNSNKIVHVCQTINGDLCGFKGILMRYVRVYAESQHLEEPMQWMEKNAWHAYQNRNSNGVIWSAWLTKTNESLIRKEGDSEKNITNDAFGSSTAVSVAFNAHVNRLFSKSAVDGLEAQNFDDIQFMQIADEMEDGTTPNTTASAANGGYICFRNVDFGTEGLNKAIIRMNAGTGRSIVWVYADSITDASLLGRNAGFLPTGWKDHEISLDHSLTGTHDVYVKIGGTGGQFHNVRFTSDGAGIDAVNADEPAMYTTGRSLNVECATPSTLNVYNTTGVLVMSRKLGVGSSSVTLQPGVYICTLTTASQVNTLKTIIK